MESLPASAPPYAPDDAPDAAPAPKVAAAPRPSLLDQVTGHRIVRDMRASPVPAAATAILFAVLFARPIERLANDWWNNPEAGHGLLLFPLAVWMLFRTPIRDDAAPNRALGLVLLGGSVLVRYLSALAAEVYTMKLSVLGAVLGLIVFAYGFRQVLRWWLPVTLLWLSIPLPELVTSTLAMPLQLQASQMGADLLGWRGIPVLLNGNVIMLPGGHSLFVAEACSGLRSLTSLLALSVLLGGMVLQWPLSRVLLVLAAIPIAILINGFRVFLTGFLVFFVSPEMGAGFMHTTEGWLMFLIAFVFLGIAAWLIGRGELVAKRFRRSEPDA